MDARAARRGARRGRRGAPGPRWELGAPWPRLTRKGWSVVTAASLATEPQCASRPAAAASRWARLRDAPAGQRLQLAADGVRSLPLRAAPGRLRQGRGRVLRGKLPEGRSAGAPAAGARGCPAAPGVRPCARASGASVHVASPKVSAMEAPNEGIPCRWHQMLSNQIRECFYAQLPA